MDKNVGGRDRNARLVIGIVFVVGMMITVAFGDGLGTTVQGALAAMLLLAAGVLLATAGAETCPVNHLLGRNTCTENR